MSGKSYEQLLREADPYRPGRFIAADQELLTQILAEPQGRRGLSRLALVAVAAAVLLAAVGVVVALNRTSAALPEPAAPSPSASSPAPSVPGAGSLLEPEKVRKASEEGPRIVVGEPGWKIIHLEPFGDHIGEMAWQKGARMLNLSWYPDTGYQDRRQDKQEGAEKVKIGDLTAWMVGTGQGQMQVMTEPTKDNGVFASLSSGPGFTRAQFRSLLAGMRTVGVDEWIAAAGGELTRRGESGDRAHRLFANGGLVPPSGWDASQLERIPDDADVFAFDTALTRQVTCGWLTRWQQAADDVARQEAGEGLLSSSEWTVLRDLERQGSGLRRQITAMAARVAGGLAGPAEIERYRKTFC